MPFDESLPRRQVPVASTSLSLTRWEGSREDTDEQDDLRVRERRGFSGHSQDPFLVRLRPLRNGLVK
jgi:hypothetical protein